MNGMNENITLKNTCRQILFVFGEKKKKKKENLKKK